MKSEKFAKLFESAKYGDILLLKSKQDGMAALELRVRVNGVDAMGYTTYTNEAGRDFVFDHFNICDAEEYLTAQMWDAILEGVGDA